MKAPLPPFDPLGLPVPGVFLQSLAYLTLTLHFVAMQFTVGGSVLLLWSWRRHPGIARFFGTGLPLGFSYLVTFGIPPLLFVQVVYGQFFYSSSVLIGAYWISVIPLIILGYGSAYFHRMTRETRPRHQRWVILMTALTVLMVGYIYVSNITLSLSPERWLGHYQAYPGGGALNYGEPTVHPRYLLFIVPALFTAGLALVLRAAVLRARHALEEAAISHRVGLRAMVVATVLEVVAVAGLWFTLPSPVTEALRTPGTLLVLSVSTAALGLASLAVAWLSKNRAGLGLPILAAHLLVGAVACLVIVRDRVRLVYLRPHFRLEEAPVIPQWGMFGMFVVTLVVGLAFLVVLTQQTVRGIAQANAAQADAAAKTT